MTHILITGCSSGIGLRCAQLLLQRGYHVVAACRQPHDVERLQQQGIMSVQMDLSSQHSIESGFQAAMTYLDGHIDALFNNAAYGQTGAIEDLPTEALRAQFETNLFGWHHLIRLVLPHMLAQNHGRIIQDSSVLGLVALCYRGAYCASKFALEGYTDTLRLELASTPIRISLIEPGPINSQFRHNAKVIFEQTIQWQQSRHKDNYQATLQRLGSEQPLNRHTLQPEAVYRCLLHALESSHPKHRYYVTRPTKYVALLRRILPSIWLDRILLKGGA
ncbi:SDR family oxidoreductase [Celerinatantimonas sp. YJH-8]|uniref:SDR family oxidoreductase n=1 Tax=Celerinatantimonas sp. YJH-8 TaxID=3228714 RepID=UPI0038C5B953